MTALFSESIHVVTCSAYIGLVVLHLDLQRNLADRIVDEKIYHRVSTMLYSVLALGKSTHFFI